MFVGVPLPTVVDTDLLGFPQNQSPFTCDLAVASGEATEKL